MSSCPVLQNANFIKGDNVPNSTSDTVPSLQTVLDNAEQRNVSAGYWVGLLESSCIGRLTWLTSSLLTLPFP